MEMRGRASKGGIPFFGKEMVVEAGFKTLGLFGHLLGSDCPVFSSFPAWSEFYGKATKTTRMLEQVRLSARWARQASPEG